MRRRDLLAGGLSGIGFAQIQQGPINETFIAGATRSSAPTVGVVPSSEGVRRNVIIAGAKGPAVDAVGASVMGFDPLALGYLREMERRGFGSGDLDSIWVRGSEIEEAKRAFRPPDGWSSRKKSRR